MGLTITEDQRASLSIDFILSVMFLLAIISSVLVIAEERLESVHHVSKTVEARLLSEKITKSIEESYSCGEGHEIIIEMPSQIDGSDYKVKVNQSGVLVKIEGKYGYSYSYWKCISNYDMNQFEVKMLPNKTYTIRNVKDSDNNHRVVIF